MNSSISKFNIIAKVVINIIKDAAIKAINSGFTKYCPVPGTPDLKDAIIKKFKEDNNLEYTREQVMASCGGKHSLFNLFQTIFDRVIYTI